jgi:hypothetical protein
MLDFDVSEMCRRSVAILGWLAIAASLMLGSPSASAFEIDTGSDVKIRWDTTLKYSVGVRVKDRADDLVSNPNGDDGDRNLNKRLISNRGDLLTEFDLKYQNVGLHASGAAWYDTVYNTSNSNDSPATTNNISAPYNEFTKGTQNLMGRKAELLDAFVFANGAMGDRQWNIRAGRHTLLWGESLLFPGNGIAYGQAPMDIIKLLGVPFTQAKELFMPVTQVSGQISVVNNLTLMAYYQLEWRKTRIPPAGSYLSDFDAIDKGGESLILGPGFAVPREGDMKGKDSGQWGVGTRVRVEAVSTDFGLYYIRFNDKNPQIYLHSVGVSGPPFVVPSSYQLVYGEDVSAVGASFSTVLGTANVAGEFSMRQNMPLANSSATFVPPGVVADNDKNPLYAVGKTIHGQLSSIYFLRQGALWQGGVFLGEVAWAHLSSITKNPDAFDTTRQKDAYGMRFILEPAYYQVFPGWDFTVPLGLGYNPRGKSVTDLKFNGGADQGGDFSIGVTATQRAVWRYSLSYTDYYGHSDTQTLKDRNFVSFAVQRTF